jgi:hypothetical protein
MIKQDGLIACIEVARWMMHNMGKTFLKFSAEASEPLSVKTIVMA